jgi:hypothetical protein
MRGVGRCHWLSFRSAGQCASADSTDRPVNFVLVVGRVSENVEVSAATAALDTSTSNVGTVITAKPISDLPLNGRNPFDLVELVPGVSTVDANGGPGKQTRVRRDKNNWR